MCGITGILNLVEITDDYARREKILREMNDCLTHRGPDDEGFFLDDRVALGQRRLSIIDLAGGRQPIFNEDKSVAIVFNGEIYNFPDLRKELEKTGRHTFSTGTDTEVIVHLYEEGGEDCLKKLNGMFAFALWDSRKQRLFCARDRMGQKPFYYSVQNGKFLFGSELKALLKHPDVPRDLSYKAFNQYLAFEYVPAPLTILKGIRKLEPGHFFVLDLKSPPSSVMDISSESYWDIPFNPHDYSLEEAKTKFVDIYRESVRRRLISDVPLGVFLSGGIDSSSVVAMMSEVMPAKDIKTFCITFREKSFDESGYARQVAEHFGTDHREESLPPERLLEILPRVCEFLDEPMADPSIIPTYLLSEFTRRYVTVALGGDGGDELFAGYDPFLAHYPSLAMEKLPRSIIHFLSRAAGLLPVSTKNISLDFKIKQFLSGMDFPAGQRHFAWLGSFRPSEQENLLSEKVKASLDLDETYSVVKDYLNRFDSRTSLDGIIYLYCKLYLQDDILVKVDRASMACSLEARAPFLDPEVVEFVGTLPDKMKIRRFTTKYLLKKCMEKYLPREIIYRKKKGFGIPIADWFKGPLRKPLEEILSEKRLKDQGLFDPAYVRLLMQQHFEGKRDNRKMLWTLFIFQKWWDRYFK